MSLICDALKESVGSLSVREIGGLYLCGRSGSDVHQGLLKVVCMLLDVIRPSLFLLQVYISNCNNQCQCDDEWTNVVKSRWGLIEL
jgi:hypothetical protein